MKPDLIIDGDGHVVEVNETYDTIDPSYLERRPVYTQASKGNLVRLVDGKESTETCHLQGARRYTTAAWGPIILGLACPTWTQTTSM